MNGNRPEQIYDICDTYSCYNGDKFPNISTHTYTHKLTRSKENATEIIRVSKTKVYIYTEQKKKKGIANNFV